MNYKIYWFGVPYTLSEGSSTVHGAHPHGFLFPIVHRGDSLGGRDSLSRRDGGCGACSSIFSGLLQPTVRRLENFLVLETRSRPLHRQDSLHDGNVSVGSSASLSEQLDGLHRPEGGILAGSHTSRRSQVPEVCGLWQALPVLGSLLRPLHGSPGLYQGYGSDLVYSPQSRHSPVSRRLAYLSPLLRSSPLCSGYSPLSLSRVGHCREPGKVQLCPCSEGSISGDNPRSPDFQGFSVPGMHRQASVSQRLISVLQAAARIHLAGSSGDSLLPIPSCSRG